jgi:hypothetical protein
MQERASRQTGPASPALGGWRPASRAVGHSRHDRGAAGLVAFLLVASFGCTTTHALGRLSDPGTLTTLQKATANQSTFALVAAIPRARQPPQGYPVSAIAVDGIRLQLAPGPSTLVQPAALQFVRTYDHVRGARDGALALGIPALVVGVPLGALIAASQSGRCADACPRPPDPFYEAVGVGAVLGLVGAVVGAGLGALAGHEERYVLAAP